MKFKRISKAKSRSLEDLRDQLRWQQLNSDTKDCDVVFEQNNAEEHGIDKSEDEVIEGIISHKTRNRLTALREYLKQYGGMAGINQHSLDSQLQFPSGFDINSEEYNFENTCRKRKDNDEE